MECLLFVIYVIVVTQFINSRPVQTKNKTSRGAGFYKISAILNMIIGICGIIGINFFLRDKDIIPQILVWIGLIGFGITIIYAMYCTFKMMFLVEP